MHAYASIGDEVFTCVAPPGYEKDPAVTAAIQEFDPGVIPFWRIQRWSVDGIERTVVHHGIGRYYPFPRHLRRHFHVAMPAEADFPAPNFLDAVFEDQECETYRFYGGPAAYMSWDWSVYYWCRRKFAKLTLKAYDERVARHRARVIAILKVNAEELEYRKRQIEPWLMKQAERLSDSDWKQLIERQKRIALARALGVKPERLKEPKAFVHVGRNAGVLIGPRSPRGAETYGRVAPAQGEPT